MACKRTLTQAERNWIIRYEQEKHKGRKDAYGHGRLVMDFFREFYPKHYRKVWEATWEAGRDPNDPSYFVQTAGRLFPSHVRMVSWAKSRILSVRLELGAI